jgi:transposase
MSQVREALPDVDAFGWRFLFEAAAMGHEVRLNPPSYVKAYVKLGKSDALDAEAICEGAAPDNTVRARKD